MGLKDILAKRLSKDEDFKAAEKKMKIQRILEQRQKSANERELERIMEKNREEAIKKKLDEIRRKETRQAFSGEFLDRTNIFKGHKSVLTNNPNLLRNSPMEKGIFFK